MEALDLALPLTLAFGVALGLTPAIGRLAQSMGAIDRPTDRSVSVRRDMPLLGGLAVAAAFFAGLSGAELASDDSSLGTRFFGVAVGGVLLLGTGIWDDRFGMKAWPKLTMQVLAAAIAIASGFEIARLTDPYSMTIVDLPRYVVWPVSLLWIVGITNALNLLDGLDGLAAGVGSIIGITLTWIAFQADQSFGVCMGLALLGGLLGFLPHNFAPARIFLGDTGSMFIGFILSLLALEGYRRISLITFVVPLLALAVPILDTTLSIVRRMRLRTPIFSADRLHMHHRLLDSEGSPRAAVLQFYFLTAAFCLIAVSFTKLQGVPAALFLLAVAALTLRLLWNLGVLQGASTEAPGDEEDEA